MLRAWSDTAFYIDDELIDALEVYRWAKSAGGAEIHRRAEYGSYFYNIALTLNRGLNLDVTEQDIRTKWGEYLAERRSQR